jgi:hypothetical protein
MEKGVERWKKGNEKKEEEKNVEGEVKIKREKNEGINQRKY